MNEHVIPENEYENYYLINQDILNEITTILNDQKLSKESIYTKARDIPRTKNLLN